MPKTRLNRFSPKRGNVKTFLFFLAFTSFLWLFIQFSKNYTQEIEVAIRYKNIPQDKLLNQDSDQLLKLLLTGNGFRFINYSWSKPVLEFDVADAASLSDLYYYFLLDKQDPILKEKLDFDGTILAVQKDTLRVKLDVNLKKKVPVVINASIQYAPGYGSEEGVLLSPDSITISGPLKVVDTIHSITLEQLTLEDINTDFETELSIDTTELPEVVQVLDKKTIASISVSKFTEGSQEIPIQLINVPKGKEVTIFPKKVKVVYRVGLKQYNGVNPGEFKVVADFKNATEENSFLILELVERPDVIHDVRMQDKQVQFVILNENDKN